MTGRRPERDAFEAAGAKAERSSDALERLAERARAWDVRVERVLETPTSVLAFGRRGAEHVVVKLARGSGGEGRFGRVLEAFDGHGTVRVHAHARDAGLLDRLRPATPLVTLCLEGEDEAATEILADVIAAMREADAPVEGFPEVSGWGESLRSHLERPLGHVPWELVEEAAERYEALCASQAEARLLHGDLHHYNVLMDADRGWLAVDPKGVVGELAYELGASLRNPYEAPDRFAVAKVIERRIAQFEARLGIDPVRTVGWAFSQAVLAAIWEAEDGNAAVADSPFLRFATSLRQMLG